MHTPTQPSLEEGGNMVGNRAWWTLKYIQSLLILTWKETETLTMSLLRRTLLSVAFRALCDRPPSLSLIPSLCPMNSELIDTISPHDLPLEWPWQPLLAFSPLQAPCWAQHCPAPYAPFFCLNTVLISLRTFLCMHLLHQLVSNPRAVLSLSLFLYCQPHTWHPVGAP